MRQIEFTNQPIERTRLFERVQVLALDVLDQRHCHRGLVGNVANDGRNRIEAGHLRGTPAAFPGNDLVTLRAFAACHRPGNDRLDNTLRPNRVCEVLERILADVGARLIPAAFEQFDWNLSKLIGLCRTCDRLRIGNGLAQQCVETAA